MSFASKLNSKTPLFVGVAGLKVERPIEFNSGTRIEAAFAHLMQPQILAFAKPDKPNSPHPSPWLPLNGAGADVEAVLWLEPTCLPQNIQADLAIWFLSFVLRLYFRKPLYFAFVASSDFEAMRSNAKPELLFPLEFPPTFPFPIGGFQNGEDERASLKKLQTDLWRGVEMLDNPRFYRSARLFDGLRWCHSPISAYLDCWSAIEGVVNVGDRQIRKRTAAEVASFIGEHDGEIATNYDFVHRNYKIRSQCSHGDAEVDPEVMKQTYIIAEELLKKCLQTGNMPAGKGVNFEQIENM